MHPSLLPLKVRFERVNEFRVVLLGVTKAGQDRNVPRLIWNVKIQTLSHVALVKDTVKTKQMYAIKELNVACLMLIRLGIAQVSYNIHI